jgi:macrolide-specific efflux system membrane fusion protein
VLTQKNRDGGYTVEVWSEQSGAVEARRITVGLNNKVTAEVRYGLSGGDLVVSGTATSAAAAGGSGTRSGTSSRNLLSGAGAGGFAAGGPPPL